MNWPAVLSAAVTGILLLSGQWVVARNSRAANDKTAEVQRDANAVDGFQRLVAELQTDVDRLRAELKELRSHVGQLERDRTRDRTLIRHLIVYAKTLRDALAKAKVPVPEPPGGLDLDGPLT